jgi:hypothetical protein
MHPLVGTSRSERLDNLLAVLRCEAWCDLDSRNRNPFYKGIARMLGKNILLPTATSRPVEHITDCLPEAQA